MKFPPVILMRRGFTQRLQQLQRKGKRRETMKTLKNIASCPKSDNTHTVAGPTLQCACHLTTDRFFTPATGSFYLLDLKCPVCQNVANEPVELQCKSPVYHNCCTGMLWKSGSGASECPSSYQAHELTINGFPGHLTCSYEVAIKSCDPLWSSKLHQACASSTPGQAHWEWLQRDGGRCCIYTNCGTSSRRATGCTTYLLGEESCRIPHIQRLHQSCQLNTFTVPPAGCGGHVHFCHSWSLTSISFVLVRQYFIIHGVTQ